MIAQVVATHQTADHSHEEEFEGVGFTLSVHSEHYKATHSCPRQQG
jgi:hypothetical protein